MIINLTSNDKSLSISVKWIAKDYQEALCCDSTSGWKIMEGSNKPNFSRLTFVGHASKTTWGERNETPSEFCTRLNSFLRDNHINIEDIKTIDLIGCGVGHVGEGTSYAFEVARILGNMGYKTRVNSLNNLLKPGTEAVVSTVVAADAKVTKVEGFFSQKDEERFLELYFKLIPALAKRLQQPQNKNNTQLQEELLQLQMEADSLKVFLFSSKEGLRETFDNRPLCGIDTEIASQLGENNWDRAIAVRLIDERIQQLEQERGTSWFLSAEAIREVKIEGLKNLRLELLDKSKKLEDILNPKNIGLDSFLLEGRTGDCLKLICQTIHKSRATTVLCIFDSLKVKNVMTKSYIEHRVRKGYLRPDIFPKDAILDNKLMMRFDGESDASEFFKLEAGKKRGFFALDVDEEQKLTGTYRFSDGEGHYIEGTLTPESLDFFEKNWDKIQKSPERKQILSILENPDILSKNPDLLVEFRVKLDAMPNTEGLKDKAETKAPHYSPTQLKIYSMFKPKSSNTKSVDSKSADVESKSKREGEENSSPHAKT